MKKLLFILILAGLSHSVRAQQYLFPIPRLKQLYFCQTKECLSKEVRGYGYTFSRTDSKEMPQEATYTYLNRQLSPYRAEALLSLHTGGIRPNIFFSTNNQSYPAQLQKEIRESGFVESADRPDPKEKIYTLREGDLVWYLTVTETTAANKPALIVGMYSFSQPVSAQTITSSSSTSTKTGVTENKNASTTQASPPANRQAPLTTLSGGLTYTPRKVERVYHRKNARGDTIASAQAVFEFPEFNDAGLNALIRRKIVKGGFYEVEAQRVVNDYKESIAEMKDDEIPATMSSEYLNVGVAIERDTPRFLLLKNDFNSYGAGAAHGEIGENYWTYDKQKKTLLTLTDLFDYAGLASLHTIAESTFRKNEKLSPTASLCQRYLFDNCRFTLAEEFRLDKNALTFVYNPYEAKSFSQGIWSVSIPYSSIQKLFRPDIWPLIEQHIVGTSRPSAPAAGDRTASAPPARTNVSLDKTNSTSETRPAAPSSNQLIGGKTPEELGIILLKALQNNDLKTWTACVHPDLEEHERNNIIKYFEWVRDKLDQDGLTNWSLVRFSRVTFENNTHKATIAGKKVASYFNIEFTYKNEEFLGKIMFWSASTQINGSIYYIWGIPILDRTGLGRNPYRR